MQQATAPLSVKRKLAAILSADVKGYSRLMAADEEGTLRTLNAYRQEMDALVAGRDGRIVGSAGDSVLAEFPSAVEATRCAVEIQEELAARNGELPKDRRLEFRIGINLGDVMVEGDDLFGDGVNVAARLQALAEPGGIYVSGGIYDQIKGKLPFGADFLGEQTVKNIAEPVRVYRLRSDRATLRRAVPRRWRTWLVSAAGLGLLVIVAAGTAWYFDLPRIYAPTEAERASAPPLPDRPSIAVLPFDNLSDNPEEEYFADGLTDDLITDLSQISGLFVIARNSVFTYKDQAVDVREVARELGVRYVLEGTRAARRRPGTDQCAADRQRDRRPSCGPIASTAMPRTSSPSRTRSSATSSTPSPSSFQPPSSSASRACRPQPRSLRLLPARRAGGADRLPLAAARGATPLRESGSARPDLCRGVCRRCADRGCTSCAATTTTSCGANGAQAGL